jgi:hypothetical protein
MSSSLFERYPATVLARFKEWHSANPQIYRQFKTLALKMKATGRKRYSARTIIEKMRWDYDIETTGDVFEINGDFVPIYVRLLIHHHPEFSNFFELRLVRSRGILSDEERKRRDEDDEDDEDDEA